MFNSQRHDSPSFFLFFFFGLDLHLFVVTLTSRDISILKNDYCLLPELRNRHNCLRVSDISQEVEQKSRDRTQELIVRQGEGILLIGSFPFLPDVVVVVNKGRSPSKENTSVLS